MTNPKTEYFPPEVMASVERVFEHGAEKHAAFGWQGVDPLGPKGIDHQVKKALGHIYKWDAISEIDESGENHLAHAITRLVIALDMILKETKDGPGRTERAPEGASQTSTVSKYIQEEVRIWKEKTGRNG